MTLGRWYNKYMDKFKSVEFNKTQFTERKSKFISFAFYCDGDWVTPLKGLKKEYPDATHICYAYKYFSMDKLLESGEAVVNQNSSDAGEPSGTAGLPILSTINALDMDNVFVAVVRYFGGVKLGTAGLANAYKAAARQCLSQVVEYEISSVYKAKLDYSGFSVFSSLEDRKQLKILNREFGTEINIEFAVSDRNMKEIAKTLNNYPKTLIKKEFIKREVL